MEVSKDGNIITTTHSNIVTFWNSKEYVIFFSLVKNCYKNSLESYPRISVFFLISQLQFMKAFLSNYSESHIKIHIKIILKNFLL